MTLFRPQRGASLLTILLLVAVVGVMVLAGARAIIESSRTSAVLAAQEEAHHIAQTGINEGLLYLSTPGTPQLTEGEYGTITDRTAATNYSLTPLRRGFTRDASGACTVQTPAEAQNTANSAIDKSCPYYDMAIRTRAAYGSGFGDITTFALSSRDFANGVPVTIPLRTTSAFFTVGTDISINQLSYALCTNATTCGASAFVARGGAFTVLDSFLQKRFIKITVSYGSAPAAPVTVLTLSNSPLQSVIGKGYTTLDVIGYSGDTQARVLYTVRAGTPFLSDTTVIFNQYGIPNP